MEPLCCGRTHNTTQTTLTQKCHQRPENPQHNNLKLSCCGFSGRWHLWATVRTLVQVFRHARAHRQCIDCCVGLPISGRNYYYVGFRAHVKIASRLVSYRISSTSISRRDSLHRRHGARLFMHCLRRAVADVGSDAREKTTTTK